MHTQLRITVCFTQYRRYPTPARPAFGGQAAGANWGPAQKQGSRRQQTQGYGPTLGEDRGTVLELPVCYAWPTVH
jgi:hypothetical protein